MAAGAVLLLLCSTTVRAGVPASEVCGDVNESGTVSPTDALLVLKNAVGQPIDLICPAIGALADCNSVLGTTGQSLTDCQGDFGTCTGDLSSTNADLAACLGSPVCGNGVVEDGEDCDGADLSGFECRFGSPLRCASGCTFDATACFAERFDATGPTILDHETGLEWERKDSGDTVADLDNPHDVDNVYSWGSVSTPYEPSGIAYTDFLGALNGSLDASCYGDHCDWRLPTQDEQKTIAVFSPNCPAPPCVQDPALLPTRAYPYWSSETHPVSFENALVVHFGNGTTAGYPKNFEMSVRAVRVGSSPSATPSYRYSVVIALDDAPGLIGSMTFGLDYAGAPGAFPAPEGECSFIGSGNVLAVVSNASGPPMAFGLINTDDGFVPGDLFRCTFYRTGEAPTALDFPVTVMEASDPDSFPYDPELVGVSIASITSSIVLAP